MFLRVCVTSASGGGLPTERERSLPPMGGGGFADLLPPQREKRAVRILLECFLVWNGFWPKNLFSHHRDLAWMDYRELWPTQSPNVFRISITGTAPMVCTTTATSPTLLSDLPSALLQNWDSKCPTWRRKWKWTRGRWLPLCAWTLRRPSGSRWRWNRAIPWSRRRKNTRKKRGQERNQCLRYWCRCYCVRNTIRSHLRIILIFLKCFCQNMRICIITA